MNRISELRKKLGLTQTRLGEEIGVSQQTISKYENVDENISGDMLLALSKFFKVPVDYILRKDEEEQQREQDNKREIMELYRDMDQYNRDTWIIIGKRLLGGQLHKYNEDSIVEKRLKCKFCSNGTPILKLAVHSFWFSGTRFLLKTVRFSFIIVM